MSQTFSRDEINAILKEAAQQQHEAATAPEPAEEGLTLGELQEVARASGIDPRFVQQAASKRMTRTGRSAKQPTTGMTAPRHYSERIVSARIDPAQFDILFDHIREVVGIEHEIGRSYARTDQLTWSKGEAWQVEVKPEADHTTLAVRGTQSGVRGLFYTIGTFLGLLFAIVPNVLLESGALGGILGLVLLVGTIAAFGTLWGQHARKWHTRMYALEERLASVILEEGITASATTTAHDAPLLDVEAAEGDAEAQRQTQQRMRGQ
ncbi:MAG: hypothetical protein AAF730_15210 [Bacteroidota bacterium]